MRTHGHENYDTDAVKTSDHYIIQTKERTSGLQMSCSGIETHKNK
jgi:hypothetical protein